MRSTPGVTLYFESVENFSGNAIANLPFTVTVPAQGAVDEPLTFTSNAFDPTGSFPFTVSVTESQGGASGTATGTLVIAGTPLVQADTTAHGVVVSLTPAQATAGQGTSASYVVQVTNTGSATDTFFLQVTGLPQGIYASLGQTSVDLPPGASNFMDIPLTLTSSAGTTPGIVPFKVTAAAGSTATTGSASGTLNVVAYGVSVSLTPGTGAPGMGFQLEVTNTGTSADTFQLALAGPAALVASLGQSKVALPAGGSQTVKISTGAVNFADAGALLLTASAVSMGNPSVEDVAISSLTIPTSKPGLSAQFSPASQTLSKPGPATLLLDVNNTGNTEGTYSATIIGTSGPVTASLIGLDGNPTGSIPLFGLPGLATGNLVLQATLTAAGTGTVTVQVTSSTGASVTETATVTTVTVSAAPTVVSFQRFGYHEQPTLLRLTFSTSMDPGRADDVHNYVLVMVTPGKNGTVHYSKPIPILSAQYDAASQSVTLRMGIHVNVYHLYQLHVLGAVGKGLTSSSGVPLAGKAGVSGTDFVGNLTIQTIVGPSLPAPHLWTTPPKWYPRTPTPVRVTTGKAIPKPTPLHVVPRLKPVAAALGPIVSRRKTTTGGRPLVL